VRVGAVGLGRVLLGVLMLAAWPAWTFADDGGAVPANEAETMTTYVTLRAGGGVVSGRLLGVDVEGVSLESDDGSAEMFSWDRVRSVAGAGSELASEFASIADRMWRARTRLERGDAPAAEPLFEALFERYAGGTGPSSRVVAEGLLRCRLRRNAYASAVEAWLAALTAGATELDTLAPGLEGEARPRWLVSALPPIWTDTPASRTLARSAWAGDDDATSPAARAMGAWYRAAAAFESGLELDRDALASARAVRDAEVEFVRAIVESRVGSPAERAGGRAYLSVRIEAGLPAWGEAWARAALGRSMLMETDEETRLLGVLELLHLPARLRGAQPYLAGLALHEAAGALASMGQGEEAARVREEFRRSFPGHPLLSTVGGGAEPVVVASRVVLLGPAPGFAEGAGAR